LFVGYCVIRVLWEQLDESVKVKFSLCLTY
jgi:hypothetical protein